MSRLPFKIKICGVTTLEDANSAILAGADACGLNFYPRSKRCVIVNCAKEIAAIRSTGISVVGVFVNQTVDEITRTQAEFQLNWIQLHGDESPDFLMRLKSQCDKPVMRALRWGKNGGREFDSYLTACSQLGCLPDAILIDSFAEGEYGGTGKTADWDAIAQWREQSEIEIALALAGGLNVDNVGAAIAIVRPDAVDTASGVESSPGKKDASLVKRFILAAKEAFEAIEKAP